MIIKKEKDNIDENSTQILNEYHKNQVQTNICLHKFCLIIIIIINLFLLGFSITYKTKISKIKNQILLKNTQIEDIQFNKTKIINDCDKKLVNIFSHGKGGKWHFSNFFKDLEEMRFLKNRLLCLLIGPSQESKSIKITLKFICKGSYDGDNFDIASVELMSHGSFSNYLFLIKDRKGNRFGLITQNGLRVEDGIFIYRERKCFLFFFDERKMYDYIGEKECIFFKNNKMIIGKNDIVINENYFEKGGNVTVPIKMFNVSDNINQKYFNEKNNAIEIEDIELFSYNYVVRTD